jgi:hypothetical protein
MSYGQYATMIELNLDEVKFCDHCQKQFHAFRRAYSWGEASAYRLSGKVRAVDAARQGAQSAADKTPSWHRCGFCGRYNSADLAALIHEYPRIRREYLDGTVLPLFVVSTLFLLLPCLLTAAMWATGDLSILYPLTLSMGLVACWTVAWRMAKRTPRHLDENEVNNPARAKLWLEEWNRHSKELIMTLMNTKSL